MRALLVFASLLTAQAFLVACGPAPSVELSQPPTPPKPTNPTKPTTPTTDPAPGDDGSVSVPTPTPAPVLPRLRAVCVDHMLGSVNTINSMARATDGVPRLKIRFENAPAGRDEVVASDQPIPVESGIRDQLDVLFLGAREVSIGQAGPLRLLLASVDLPTRDGRVVELGASVPLASEAREAAENLGVQARNFGASDRGTYLIVPRSKAFEVLSHRTLARLATIPLDPSKTLMPQIFEGENLLTALVYERGAFKVSLVKLSVQPGSVVASAASMLAPPSGATYYSPSLLDAGKLVWVEADAKFGVAPRALTFVTYGAKDGSLGRARLTSTVASERLSPQVAVVHKPTRTVLAVALEVSAERGPDPLGRSRQLVGGRLAYIELTTRGPVEIDSLPYPAYVLKESQTFGFDGNFAVRRVLAPTGAREVLMSIDTGATDEMLFKERGGALDGVGGLACRNPNVIEEVP